MELVIGSTAVSLGLLLATFMGGMCAGSLMFPRVVLAQRHPLRAYAAIELGVAICGVLVLFAMPLVLSRAVAAIILIPPTLLMGATLPVLSRCLDDTPSLGFLYGVNIAGAVFGCLLSGFYLLREFDVAIATYVAVAVNAIVAIIALVLTRCVRAPGKRYERGFNDAAAPSPAMIYVAIGLSGFCALAAETIWTRLLGLLFGASVYAFSIIVAVFLVGLGIGSGIGSMLCRSIAKPRAALGWSQLLLAMAIAWTAYNLSASLPYWPINPAINSSAIGSSVWFNFELDLDRAFWALLPPTLLWGASFPLALRAASSPGQDSAKLMARVYSANTLGAILGALSASLLLIAWIGSQHTQQLLIGLSGLAGLLLLIDRIRLPRILLGAATALVCGLLILSVPPLAKLLVAYGRYAATWVGKGEVVYAAEGVNSSVAVASFPNGIFTFHVAGKIQASNVPRDMRLQRMLGHLTTLTVAHPRTVLVIGCGAGITAGAVSIDPRVEQETIAEIEPLVPKAAATYFREPNFAVLKNPKAHVRLDDGRHYLLTTHERFDGITVDPLDPWVKGAANLYTKEFFEAMKQHLNPGGTVTMYIQLFETDIEAVKSSLATFFQVFPSGTLWGNPYQGQGHDMVLLGQAEPLRIDLDEMERRFGYRDESNKIPQSLAEVGMNSPEGFFATYAGRGSDLTEWLKGAAINRDRNLRMQYLAGLGLDLDEAASIYAEILKCRQLPADMFTGTEGRVDSLRSAMQRAEP